jgi:hypothetical protein
MRQRLVGHIERRLPLRKRFLLRDQKPVAPYFVSDAAKPTTMKDQKHPTEESTVPVHAELIRELINCALACEACATACLGEEDVTLMTRCIELDRDCADICTLGARLLIRESETTSQYLTMTEEICQLCADECSKHEHAHCKACAEACLSCAEACRLNHGSMSR